MNKKNFDKLIDIAFALLPEVDDTVNKHFSFILKRNNILSIGWCKPYKTHPLCKELGYRFHSLHSETDVILKALKSKAFKDTTLVNIRLSSLSTPEEKPILRLSRPCISCQKLIVDTTGIKRVYYSTRNGFEKF